MPSTTSSGGRSARGHGHAYKGAFLQAVELRKQVEQDAQLLANRIKLLKVVLGDGRCPLNAQLMWLHVWSVPVQQEESKAWKKIQQTKERAESIMRLREEHERRLDERAAKKLEESSKVLEARDKRYMSKEVKELSKKVGGWALPRRDGACARPSHAPAPACAGCSTLSSR